MPVALDPRSDAPPSRPVVADPLAAVAGGASATVRCVSACIAAIMVPDGGGGGGAGVVTTGVVIGAVIGGVTGAVGVAVGDCTVAASFAAAWAAGQFFTPTTGKRATAAIGSSETRAKLSVVKSVAPQLEVSDHFQFAPSSHDSPSRDFPFLPPTSSGFP